jgi:hypothetical protein
MKRSLFALCVCCFLLLGGTALAGHGGCHKWGPCPTPTPTATPTPSPTPTPTPTPTPAPLFEDTFTQPDGPPNPLEWSTYNGPGHAGIGLRRPAQCQVIGGMLRIRTEIIDGVVHNCGLAHRLNRTYGSFEARVRTDPNNNGSATSGVVMTWPACVPGCWPTQGESDFYETSTCLSSCDPLTRNPFHSFIHWDGAVAGGGSQQDHYVHNANAVDWHVMRMDWSPGLIEVRRDGVLAGATTGSHVPNDPHHFVAQLDELGSDRTFNPVDMWVDDVRIWAP